MCLPFALNAYVKILSRCALLSQKVCLTFLIACAYLSLIIIQGVLSLMIFYIRHFLLPLKEVNQKIKI